MPLRVVFMGTPDFAVPTLASLIGSGHEVAAVYCQPAKPSGRGMETRPSPVQTLASTSGLTIRTPTSLRGDEASRQFAAHDADVAVVVAYGLLLPATILSIPRHGCLNLHPSKLPRWRGAAPIQRTLMAGDTDTALCVMRMDEGLDTGPVCLSQPLAIDIAMTAGSLHDMAARQGAGLMLRALGALERGTLECRPQSAEGATYAAKITKGEARIDWSKPARSVHDHIRGLSPFPGAWFEFTGGAQSERIKVLESGLAAGRGRPGLCLDDELTVACGEGAVQLRRLQRPGKKPMAAIELIRGFAVSKDTVLL